MTNRSVLAPLIERLTHPRRGGEKILGRLILPHLREDRRGSLRGRAGGRPPGDPPAPAGRAHRRRDVRGPLDFERVIAVLLVFGLRPPGGAAHALSASLAAVTPAAWKAVRMAGQKAHGTVRAPGLPATRRSRSAARWAPAHRRPTFARWCMRCSRPLSTPATRLAGRDGSGLGFPFMTCADDPQTPPGCHRRCSGFWTPVAPIVFTLGSAAVWVAKDFFEQGIAAAKALGRRALLLVGDGRPPGSPPEGVASFDYAPYGRLLPHARLVVHHGGIGTTAHALRAGLLMSLVRP